MNKKERQRIHRARQRAKLNTVEQRPGLGSREWIGAGLALIAVIALIGGGILLV
ncbi:MAG TPA: hypothetical protein VFO84_05115 [Dehalococcoidia bacterium]|nr:hypothetical protein [Dehalococcoidia bacterium]